MVRYCKLPYRHAQYTGTAFLLHHMSMRKVRFPILYIASITASCGYGSEWYLHLQLLAASRPLVSIDCWGNGFI